MITLTCIMILNETLNNFFKLIFHPEKNFHDMLSQICLNQNPKVMLALSFENNQWLLFAESVWERSIAKINILQNRRIAVMQ